MTRTAEKLTEQVAALDRALASTGCTDSVEAAMEGASDAALLELLQHARSGVLLFEAVLARASGEVARRSAATDDLSLAKRLGERSAVDVVAKEAGLAPAEAATLVRVGRETAPRLSIVGETLEPERPHIAAALDDGALSVELARLISMTLRKVEDVLSAVDVVELERRLVRMATD